MGFTTAAGPRTPKEYMGGANKLALCQVLLGRHAYSNDRRTDTDRTRARTEPFDSWTSKTRRLSLIGLGLQINRAAVALHHGHAAGKRLKDSAGPAPGRTWTASSEYCVCGNTATIWGVFIACRPVRFHMDGTPPSPSPHLPPNSPPQHLPPPSPPLTADGNL